VAFLTADENKENEKRVFELGADDYISKPFEADVLVHRVRNILERHPEANHFEAGLSTNKTGLSDRVVVVDDDSANLKVAERILSRNNMNVTTLSSGRELLEHIASNEIPDIILLDIKMPDMDGFETLKNLREREKELGIPDSIPVIFLTADESDASEATGLKLGAMDFIRKPFAAEVLTLRVRHLLELIRLQRDLHAEVERKTQEIEGLSLHVVHSLADAIDAKDAYTKGHSGRVADYSREIAKRFGYSAERQEEIYMMGLLHDVGKIGVPDEVINKPGKLTDEEFAKIKTHPGRGARILENIKEMPKLATGARWHHERYDGRGYPDGLAGENIPEEARIIAVADAYDAMTSHRSYRDVIPQEVVKGELEKGSGTQFDPQFAAIMLEIIKEDVDYKLREQ
jgi:putative two-component system response regulator